MPIDEIEAKLKERTWQEKVADRKPLVPIDLNTQHLGNRVISHFYPEHWARVQIARHHLTHYGQTNDAD